MIFSEIVLPDASPEQIKERVFLCQQRRRHPTLAVPFPRAYIF